MERNEAESTIKAIERKYNSRMKRDYHPAYNDLRLYKIK
jgi:hypothetical protein